MLKQEAHQEMR